MAEETDKNDTTLPAYLVTSGEADVIVNAVSNPQELSDALKVRREWMNLMGLSQEEIAENCGADAYPASLSEELENLAAMKRRGSADT